MTSKEEDASAGKARSASPVGGGAGSQTRETSLSSAGWAPLGTVWAKARSASPVEGGGGSQTQETSPTRRGWRGWDPLDTVIASPTCRALCCKSGEGWVLFHRDLEHYRSGRDDLALDRWALSHLRGSVPEVARDMVRRGLAAWDTLHPTVRERMSRWSPLARQLWDSPFPDHQEAMVRAWIWHYLDDNIFSFSGDAQGDELVPCASPVWEHVRALRRALDGLRTGEKESMFPETLCRQFHMLRRLIESLVVDGLGLKEYVTAADFIPHFKKSLRLLVDDGHAKIPDRDHDVNWDLRCEDPDDEEHEVCDMIKDMLYHALELRFFIHGMIPSYTIRFIPIGSNSLWGFPVDRDWMSVVGTPEISQLPPGERPVRVVQLVSDPMLVISGEDWEGYEKDFKRWPQQIMRVFAPWCRDGEVLADYIGREDEEKRLWPILEENGQERMVKRLQEEEEQMEEVEQEKRPKRAQEIVGRVTRSMSAKGAERVKRPKRAQEIVGRVTRSMSAKGAERVKRTE